MIEILNLDFEPEPNMLLVTITYTCLTIKKIKKLNTWTEYYVSIKDLLQLEIIKQRKIKPETHSISFSSSVKMCS